MSIAKTLKQVERAIKAVKVWSPVDMGHVPAGAQAFTGKANGWTFIVVEFPLDDQGAPGMFGYDGTATLSVAGAGPLIVRLVKPLAKLACDLAKKSRTS